MNFTDFYGNEPIKTILNAHLFHAYLIEGPEGSGKHTLADKITNALVCDGENPPCGICRQCYKFRQDCHPDIIRIPAEIPVDELRQVLAGIVLTPNDAKHKIYRIDNAEKLHPTAQNLLLKTLEEPPHYAVFILLCNTREGVLQTVRSRCQVLSLAPLPEETIREHFIKTFGEYDEKAKEATLLSAGFLGKALKRYGEEGDGFLEACVRLEKAAREGNAAEALKLFHYDNRESLLAFYNAFSLYIKRKLRQCAESDRAFYSTLVQKWDEAAQPMQANVNVKFWNTNLPRICLNAGRDATRRKDRI